MAANTSPIFILTGFGSPVSFTATADRTNSGTTAVTVVTAGTNGSKIYGINFAATGTTNETTLLIFHRSGATYRLVGEIPVQTVTPSNITPAWEGFWSNPNPGPLKSGDIFCVAFSSGGSSAMIANPLGGDY